MADVKGTRAALDQLVQSGALPPPGGGARPQVVAPSAAARNPSDAIDQLVQRGLLPPPGGGARQLPLVEQALSGTMGARPGPTTARAELAGTTRMGPTVDNAQALTILRRADQLLREGASPDVVAEVRKVARETGDSLPLAAQTYAERAARISDDRGAALLAANPGLAKLVDRHGYADLAKDLEPLIVAEQAYAEANSGVERLGIILADTLVGRAVQRGSLQTAAGTPRLIAGANLGVALDIGATEEQILERLAAPYGGVDALQSYPPAVRTLILQTARDRYNAVQGMTEEDAVQALQTAAEYYFSAQNLVLQAEGLARNPGSQSFVENTLASAPNTVLGTLDAFAQDPVNGGLFLAETVFESAPQMLVTMLVSRGTGSLVAGATAGGVAGLSREYVLSTTQFLAERGYTISSVDDAVAVLQNAELMQQAAEFGFARAVPIAVLDALAGALSGVQLGRTAIGDAAGQMLLQGAAGAGGETLAQIFSEGQVTNLQDITIEFLAELPTGLIEGPLVAGRSFGGRRAAEQALQDRLDAETRKLLSDQGLQTALDAATAAQEALETTRAAIEETATFARDPEAVRELLEAAGDQEVSIPVQEIERLYQEGALTDDDIAYLQVEDELTQQGDLSGDVSTTASRVLTLQGDAFARLSEHVRTQPGAPTTAEAREALANREADIERLQGVLEQAQAAADEVGVLSERIAAEVRAAAPQYTAAQGRAMGRLLAERYAARAALFEPGTTAQSLYERDKVAFEAAGQAAAPGMQQAPLTDADVAYNEQVRTPAGLLDRDTVLPSDNILYRPDRAYRFIGELGYADFLESGQIRAAQGTKKGYQMPYFMRGKSSSRYGRGASGAYMVEAIPSEEGWRADEEATYTGPLAPLTSEDRIRIYRRLDDGSFEVILDNIGDRALLTDQAAPTPLEQAAASVGMRTPEFQTWFADSKVVDDAGQPLVVYHGTASAFEAFDPGRTGQGDPGFLGSGFYFGDNKSIARSYAMMRPGTDERVIEAHLSLQNPFMWGPKGLGVRGFVQDGDRLPDAIHDEVVRRSGYGTERIPSSEYEAAERTVSRVVREVLEERGYDGVIATDDFSNQPIEFVAFRPEQIKDVTNERPTAAPSMFEQAPLADNDTSVAGGLTEKSYIKTRSLEGATIFPMFADLTDAGSVFDALDGMPIVPTSYLGGPNFPWLKAYRDANIVWAFNKPGVITGVRNKVRELQEQARAEGRSDRVVITMLAMKEDAHTSNEMTINALLRTLNAVVQAGRFPAEQLTKAKELITGKAGKADDGYSELATFPGFGDAQALHDWIRGATFPGRKAVATEMRSAAFQKLPGMFPVERIVREAVDPDYRATQQGDALLAFEIDPDDPNLIIDFDDPEQAGDVPRHPAYRYGMRGNLVGSFETHIPMEVLYGDLLPEVIGRSKPGSNPKFLMERLKTEDGQVVTPDIVRQAEVIEGLHDYRVAQAYTAGIAGQWRSSDDAANKGGINPVEFERALIENEAAATLTKYTRDDIKEGKKDGSLRAFQLGTARVQDGGLNVWMAVKKGLDYRQKYPGDVTDALVEQGILTDNEVALVGVASNELGVSGMATFQVLKGIEEGVTVLDAFKVRSPSKPDGLLPTIYATLGFEEVGSIPFDPQEFDDQQIADLKAIWTRQGWDEADGYPAVAIMKWRGSDDARPNATQRFIAQGQAGLGIGGRADVSEFATEAGDIFAGDADGGRGDGGTGAGDGRADPRRYADRARTVSGRARDFVSNVLAADQRAIDALKLPQDLLDRIREAYPSATTMLEQQTLEQPAVTDTSAFREWFGDSKVVDDNGDPLVVYHHGSFDEQADVPAGPMHFGTAQAARERAFGKAVDDAAMQVEAYQAEGGVWHWDDGSGTTSEDMGAAGFSDEATAIAYGRSEVIRQMEDGGLDVEADDLGATTAVYLNIRNPKRVADAGGAEGEWDAVIEQAIAEGHDGIVYRNQFEDKGSDSYIAFSPTQIKSVSNVGTFDPNDPRILYQPSEGPQTPDRGAVGAPRGQYVLPTSDDPRNLIQLTTTADPSTFVHEVGHMFLFQMLRDLQDPRITAEGRAQIEAQIAATRAWFESNAEQGLSDLKALAKSIDRRAKANKDDIQLQTRAARLNAAVERANAGGGAAYMQRVAQSFMDPQGAGYDEAAEVVYHELWARGFEQYLGTGSAPSAELRGVFAKFVAYITKTYETLRRLNVTVSPEVADVFDRLLATEDAINAERRGALYQVSPGVLEGATPAEANELRRLAAEAEDEARTQIARREQNALNQQERAKRSARREQLTLELTDQVAAEPVYTAVTILTTGSTPNGEVVFATGAIKLNRADVVAQAGEALADAIPNRLISGRTPPTTSIDLGSLAAQSGFDSIDELLLALSDENLTSLSEAVRQRVDDQMDAEFGAETDPDALSDEAIEAAQNDKFQQLQQLQLRILRRLATQPMQRLAQRQAEQQGAPAAAADTAATEAARAEQAAARTPREGVQAALARIRADVQRTANASQRRAQAAAGRTTRGIQRNVDPAAVEAAAERFVANLKVKDATPARYRQAAARLTTKIERAIAARNYTEASSLMEQRALNLAVAKRAAAVQSKIEQQRTRWRDITARSDKRLAQRYSIDWINAIRVMLEPFGMARSTPRNYDANKALAALASVEPTLLADIQLTLATYGGRAQAARQAIPNAPYKDLGVQEALDMLETADTMLANARDSYGILVEGRRVEFAAISDEVAINVGQRRKVQKQARAEARGRGSRAFRETRRKISGFKASLRRIELWARDIDNGNPRGPMTRYLVRPVMRAVDAYTEARRGPQEALANLLRGRTDIMARKLIKATELDGYVFQSKGELLMALLHTGNPSNKRKLLLGGAEDVASQRKYVWGSLDADGNLDTTRWDRFIARLFADGTLTKADMDLVQGIWDIFEQTKKPAQAAHKQMYGYYFTEIEAEPLITPVGTYRGGYAPAVTDVMMNSDGNRFEAEEVMSQQSNAAMFPGAEKGFTQSRTEYNKPLDLDLTRIPAHFDRVMKFAYLGPAVRQAARLVTSPAFREAVRPASPDVIDVAVIPWLQRTVQQLVTTPPANQGSSLTSSIAAAIDRRVGLHVMAGNLVNAAQQGTGFAVAAARIPARHIAVAFTQWRVDNQSARAYILSRSTFMQDRLTGGMNEASTTLESILTEPGLLNKAQNAAMRYGYFAQQMAQNLVDPTVWLAAERHGMEIVYPAAYAEALERTGDEAAADAAARAEVAEYADSVVRDTQAPLRPSDISGIEASSPLARIFLKFYSYFNAMGNLLVTEKNIAMNSEMGWAGRYGRSFYAYLLIMYIPTVVAESISQLARGGFDDLDDEDERNQLLFEIFIGSQIKTLAATVPYFGALVSTTYGVAVTEQVYDDRINLSAGIGVTESTVTNVVRLVKAAADPDTDVDTRRAIRATLDAMGLAVGLPTGWAAKPISYAASVAEGDSDPEGLLDIVQGVLTGRDGTE